MEECSKSVLLDTGADRTFFSVELFRDLQWAPDALRPPRAELSGLGGASGYVCLTTTIELRRSDGNPVRLFGEFAALTDPPGPEMSLLGRDVLDLFDLVLSRERNEILLLRPLHYYLVAQA
jgi:hypothetical protein